MNKSLKTLSNVQLSTFCSQMALILKSGISAIEGIEIMRDDAAGSADFDLYASIYDAFARSGQFNAALEESGVFPDYMVHMIQVGEETGSLDDVCDELDHHYQREESVRQSIRNALVYPMIMAGMMIVVLLVLITQVMPVFSQVFSELGADMNSFSRGLMNFGTVLKRYSVLLLILLILILAAIFFLSFTAKGQECRDKLGDKIGFVRKRREDLAACRFASAMALTLKSGLHPEEGIDLALQLNEDPAFAEKLTKLKEDMENGRSLSDCLTENHIFNGVYARLASIGFRAGALDQVMEQIADLYQDSIDARLSNRLSILEPALIIVLSVLVGIILLSVMFPLLGIMSGI